LKPNEAYSITVYGSRANMTELVQSKVIYTKDDYNGGYTFSFESHKVGDELDYDIPSGADDVVVYAYGDKVAEKGDILEPIPYLAVIKWDEDDDSKWSYRYIFPERNS